MIVGPRIEGSLLTVAGVAVAAGYLWWRWLWLLFVGLFLAGVGVNVLVGLLRRPAVLRVQDRMIRDLWRLLRRLPGNVGYVDPVTGNTLVVQREQGFLTLAVIDSGDRVDGTIVRYMVGFAAAPSPPPLLRHTAAAHAPPPARMSLQQACEWLRLDEVTGVMRTGNDELAGVRAQLDRALAAARPGGVRQGGAG